MEAGTSRTEIAIEPELYFLIARFLEAGPCREVSNALKRELERAKILPQRIDWEGNPHNQTFEELAKKYPHIGPNHLLQICARIGPVLEKEVPPCVPGAVSLLGAGKQSMLRTKEDVLRQVRSIVAYSGRLGGKPFLEQHLSLTNHNVVRALQGRENSGPLCRRQVVPTTFYSKLQMYRHTLGHLSAVYCVLYDRTGRYVITGADDLLVKVWSVLDGRLLATFRGASAEIMDITVNFDNTLLAAGSLDRILRVWCFQTMSPVAVLSGHSGMITSVNFCPILCNGINYLVSTSTDGSVAFWPHTKKYNERAVFQPKPIQYHEKMRPGQAQMICASFSPGGAFMAAGSADHNVRVYAMLGDEGPRRVLEVEAHSDTVDSIQWAHSGLKFISGSKDGTANVWHFEQQQWMHKRLAMTTKLPGDPEPEDEPSKKTKVTMVSWDVSDEWVITAVSDCSLKVWNARTGELTKVLRGHKDEVFVLESHPIDPRVILSTGHDGQLIIWDVLNTEPIVSFQNFIEGQGKGAIFDAKWSPDGTMLAATDSHGHLLMYGFGAGPEKLKIVPKELFFHTDYRPLMRDANNYVLDEQTQTAPHLMPPPFLVDVDGNPYPPALQRLVPGRENCRGEQLVPNIAVGASGMQEVIEGLPIHEPRSNIDRLIEALAQRQNIQGQDGEMVDERDDNGEAQVRQIASPRGHRPGLRRAGDVEGIRQTSGNWQRDNTTPWNKPILAKPVHPAVRETLSKLLNAMAEMELENWRREMKRRPQAAATTLATQGNASTRGANRKRNRGIRHGYRTRAARGEEQDEEDIDNIDEGASGSSVSNHSNDSSAEEMSSDTTSSESSSEYSDWIADHGLNLEPPKRSKRKRVNKVSTPPSGDSDRKRNEPRKKKLPVAPAEVTEVPDIFRPSEWLTEAVPHKTPYYPQMGDEVVYFRQGHQAYIDAIRRKKVYDLGPRSEPWAKINLRAHEFVKVVGIKYEIRPPRLCCLKLALMDEDGHLTGENFTIKYHDMQDVVDFLVLRQTFDTALGRNWSEGDRFRCIIDDSWWMGTIENIGPYDEAFPESYFLCFGVRWDNGEDEKVSAWDLEAVDYDRLPSTVGGAVPVLPEELQTILYQPQPEEWPMGDREAACRRISRGLDQVMGLAIAEPFTAPVDLNLYPIYSYIVEYPMDLSTIKARLENHFYRRITSAQFDVRYLATNAEQFNEPHSQIVKRARIITDLCLKIIKENVELDIPAVYHQLVDTYHSSDSEIDVEATRERPSTSRQRPTTSRNLRSQEVSKDWRVACRQLLETLWQCEDSIPFREPVDRLENPDYHHIVDTPMDLQTVKEDLIGGNYESPVEFAKDMKLIFTNSRNYNTNKRSQIYLMTIRLSAMFDEHMRKIISTWKTARRRTENAKAKAKANQRKRVKTRLTNGAGPSRAKSEDSSEDEDDDNVNGENDDEEPEEPEKDQVEPTRQRRKPTNPDAPGPSTSRMTNGHSKSAAGKSSRRLRNSRAATSKKAGNSESEVSESEMSMESDSSFEKTRTRRTRTRKAVSSGADSDSGDSYKPGGRGKQTRKNRAKNSKKPRQKVQPRRLLVREDEEDEEEEEEEEEQEEQDGNEEEEQENDGKSSEEESDEEEEEEENEIVTRNTTRSRTVVVKQKQQRVTESNNVSEDGEESEDSDSEDSDENEEEEEEEEEDEEKGGGGGKRSENGQKAIPDNSDSNEDSEINVETTRSQRSIRSARTSENDDEECETTRRTGKRPRYNVDDSDDDDDDDDDDDSSSNAPVRNRRSVKRRYYAEESDDEAAPEPAISISSRGRVRKMTARARAYLREAP